MEPDNTAPKPYHFASEPFKTAWMVLMILAVPDVLRNVWSINTWLAEIAGLACSLLVMALAPPRPKIGKLAVLATIMCLIVAVQYLVHSLAHSH